MMTTLPSHRSHLCPPRFKERLAVGINDLALFGTDDIRGHPLSGDTGHVWKGIFIQQVHQAMKGIGLALVGSGRKEQQIGRGFGQALTEFITGNMVCAAPQTMSFIHHHHVPSGGDQFLKSAAVVVGYALGCPAAPLVHGLDRIQRDDDLIEHQPGRVALIRP